MKTTSSSPKNGFTLVELMVVVVIIGILASIGIPRIQIQLLIGRLNDAKPYLMAIAAKERMRYTQRGGNYYSTTNELNIKNELGVDLKDAGDFCFMIRTGTENGISASAPTEAVGFEVWGVLRNTTLAAVSVTNIESVTCTPLDITDSTKKNAPSGWVNASGVAGQGRVIVLRYPPPVDGYENDIIKITDNVTTTTYNNRRGRSGFYLDWSDGITITDAIF